MTRRSDSWFLPGLAAGLAAAALAGAPASAQEALFLRIRPSGPDARATGSGRSDAEVARAAHEAVWARSTVRANLAIASVCTGCLGPAPAPTPLRPERPRPTIPPESAQAALAPADPSRDAAASPVSDPPSTRGDP